MKRTIMTTGLLVTLVINVNAQSTSNVEKAVRFRASQVQSTNVVQTTPQKMNSEKETSSLNVTALPNHSSAQLEELGTRYAVAWSRNAAQLQELGTRYANGLSGGNAAQ
ncbi:MAG: hypothetical protein ACE5HX_12730, partial [bacterium]